MSHRTPENPCPNCGAKIDAASMVAGDVPHPSPGDFTVCLYCHHLMAYGDDLKLRALTSEEVAEAAGDPEVLKAMEFVGEYERLKKEGKL